MIPRETWWLPRPRKNKYPGGFPLHFEKKLYAEIGNPEKILHPFGGCAEFGDRVDLNPEVNPDFVGDAHNLDFIANNSYDCVVLDPPYDDEQAKKLYNTPKLKHKQYVAEAVRVCKVGGYVCVYHWVLTPRPEGTKFFKIIIILTRVWHRPRVCCIYQKE